MYWKLLEIGVFSLSNTGLGVAKLMDIGSKLLATVGVALTVHAKAAETSRS